MKHTDGFELLDLLNDIDDNFIVEANQPLPKEKEYLFVKRAAGMAAVLILLFLAFYQRKPVQAMLGKVTSVISEFMVVAESAGSYMDVKNTTKTKDGVSVTLKEVLLSEEELAVSFLIDDEVDADMLTENAQFSLYINGKEQKDLDMGTTCSYETIEGKIPFVVTWDGNAFPVNIRQTKINLVLPAQDEKEISFSFAFSASREELEKNTLHKTLNNKVLLKDGEVLQLHTLVLNDINSKIEATCTSPLSGKQEYQLQAVDSEGNEADYYVSVDEALPGSKEQRHICFETANGSQLSSASKWIKLQVVRRKNAAFEEETVGEETGEDWSVYQEVFVIDDEEEMGEAQKEPKWKPFSEQIKINLSVPEK